MQENPTKENSYLAYYRGKQTEVNARTSLEAQQLAAQQWRVKKAWDVTIVLVEKNGKPVSHIAAMI